MGFHLTLVRIAIIRSLQTTNVREGVEKRELFYIAGGNENWSSRYGKQYRVSLKN